MQVYTQVLQLFGRAVAGYVRHLVENVVAQAVA